MEITIQLIVFLVFALVTLGGGIGVVLARNLFRAALFLLLSLFGVAGLFVLLSAPFLAAVQVLIYMGGIAILIIFAVMLTRGMVSVRHVYNHQWDLAAVVAVAFLAMMVFVLVQMQQGGTAMAAAIAAPGVVAEDSTAQLGAALVDPAQYMLPFEVASVLLAGALVGAIYIARDDEAE